MPKTKPPEERKTEKLVLCVTAALKEQFQARCALNGVTMSEAVREFMEGKA